jgi:hypothetical protein
MIMDQHCHRHKDTEGVYFCGKYAVYHCEKCLSCRDPKAYCKYRTSCMIHEIEKHGTPEFQRARATVIE